MEVGRRIADFELGFGRARCHLRIWLVDQVSQAEPRLDRHGAVERLGRACQSESGQDGLLEFLPGLRAFQSRRPDEEGGGLCHAEGVGFRLETVYPGENLGRFAVAIEARHVQPGLARISVEVGVGEAIGVVEEFVRHGPEGALPVGGKGGRGRTMRVVAVWVVAVAQDGVDEWLENEADAVAVGEHQIVGHRLHLAAVGAQEVLEHHDRGLGMFGAQGHSRVRADGGFRRVSGGHAGAARQCEPEYPDPSHSSRCPSDAHGCASPLRTARCL